MERFLSDHSQDGNVPVGGIGNLSIARRGPSAVSEIRSDKTGAPNAVELLVDLFEDRILLVV